MYLLSAGRSAVGKICTIVALVSLVATVFLTGCGGSSSSTSSSSSSSSTSGATGAAPKSLISSGEINYCSDLSYPPEEFLEGTTPTGAEVEFGEAVAERLGVTAHFNAVGFDGIIASLLAKKCDAILSSMAVTPDREKQVDFVKYEKVGQSIMVQTGNPEGIESFDYLAGKSVATQTGTALAAVLEEFNSKAGSGPKISIQLFGKDTDAVSALQSGRVDAYFSDAPPVAYYVNQDPSQFEEVGGVINEDPWGLAIRKGETELQSALTKAVGEVVESGQLLEYLKNWDLAEVSEPFVG